MSEAFGLIDVHNHLLPGIDDGCPTIEESLACARILVANGYTHAFCTPHIWPNLPHNSVKKIPQYVAALQATFDENSIPLKLTPGGELNIHPAITQTPPDQIVTYAMAKKYVLVDLWADHLPKYLFDAVSFFHDLGLTVILAHPERMRAIQDDPDVIDELQELGVLLQGNLQCLADPPNKDTRRVIDQFLEENRYFLLGSDLHALSSLPSRMTGLARAKQILSPEKYQQLFTENPRKLLPQNE